MNEDKEMLMSTGQTILMIGVILVVAAALTLLIGEGVLGRQKKKVLRTIEREYR